jgi:hypothetical protein
MSSYILNYVFVVDIWHLFATAQFTTSLVYSNWRRVSVMYVSARIVDKVCYI